MTSLWPGLDLPQAAAAAAATGLPCSVFCSRLGDGQAVWALCRAWQQQGPSGRLIVCAVQAPGDPAPTAPALASRWPPPTPGLHLLDFADGQIRLLLAVGLADPWRAWRQLQAQALWVDPTQPVPPAALARLAAPGAVLAWPQATAVQQAALRSAGFVPDSAAGPAGWHYQPRSPAAQRAPALRPPGQALVLGAGIAGACVAAALARRGWACTVLDAQTRAAAGASGNPAAIVHGTVHAQDGPHARYTRAAALWARQVYLPRLEGCAGSAPVPGSLDGLLRAGAEAVEPAPPAPWAQRWDAKALAHGGSPLRAESAWFFPGGGWVAAAGMVQALLSTPGVRFVGGQAAARIQRLPAAGPRPPAWALLDAAGRPVAEAEILVLAQGGDWRALLQGTGAWAEPTLRARGQITWFAHAGPMLRWPVAGGGYALTPGDGTLLCGATTQAVHGQAEPAAAGTPGTGSDTGSADGLSPPGDVEALQDADHAFNLARLARQTGLGPPPGQPLQGRAGWRERTVDRLPLAGPLADAQALARLAAPSLPALAQLPRLPGLYGLGAMAGRGFTWGPLAGELLASWVDGSVLPLEATLVDALDPARLWLRRERRSGQPERPEQPERPN